MHAEAVLARIRPRDKGGDEFEPGRAERRIASQRRLITKVTPRPFWRCLAGEVETGLVTHSVALKHLQAGTLRPLAAVGNTRCEQFPEVRTLEQSGLDIDYSLWSGLFVPSETRAGPVDALRRAVRSAVADPQFRSAVARMQASIA